MSIIEKVSLGKRFKLYYYISSLLPQYIVLIILLISEDLEEGAFSPNFHAIFTSKKIILFLFIFLSVISWHCLCFIKHKLDEVRTNSSELFNSCHVQLSYNVNPGMKEFSLNILIPIMSIFISVNLPISSFIIIILIQLIMLIVYFISSDIFPNVSLCLIHYNVYKIKNSQSNMKYILGKSTRLVDRTYYSGKKVTVIPLVPDRRNSNNSKFAVIKGKSNK